VFRSIRWRLATAFIVLIIISIGGLSAYLVHFVRGSYLSNLDSQLTHQAQLVGDVSDSYFANGQTDDIDVLAKRLGEQIDARITLIDKDGVVLGDSDENPAVMENHGNRPEVIEALSTGTGSSIRYSATLGCDMMYVAVPVTMNGEVVGIARVSLPLTEINKSLGYISRTIIAGAAIAAIIAILLAIQLSRTTTEPVKKLTKMAKRMAEGELDQEIRVTARDEVGDLAGAFNQMSARLREMVALLTTERDKMAAVVSTMGDGVIIVDSESRVNMVNKAAEAMFRLSENESLGNTFIEVVHDHELDEVLRKCLKTREQQTGLVETESGKQFLRVIATPLWSGSLVLLQDLTQIRRLETVRRDFISNISHELRTPITSLKILTETIQEGAIEDRAVAQDFLNKINTETDRLAQMVDALAELSHIESGEVSLKLEPVVMGEIAQQVAERLRAQVDRAGLNLEVDIPLDLPRALADKERMEQVLVNLLHNAIKFTSPGGRISISAKAEGDNIQVSVADTGVGIPADDLPRIFERFYKADKARAGAGTGLGLAITKHIVEAHSGSIWAESTEGKGSIFTFTLPAAADS
jgi:two-component system phosphate regulon sensor histidine kinase PhoR